jgi:hypothetical protein
MSKNCVNIVCECPRVSVQGVKSLGGHFACLCQGFEIHEVNIKKNYRYFSKRKGKYFYTFNHFYSEKSSKRGKQHKSTTMTPNLLE